MATKLNEIEKIEARLKEPMYDVTYYVIGDPKTGESKSFGHFVMEDRDKGLRLIKSEEIYRIWGLGLATASEVYELNVWYAERVKHLKSLL